MMNIFEKLQQAQNAKRIAELDMREAAAKIPGDFEGSVTGHWVRLDATGGGVVSYNNKEYLTKPIGFASLPKGLEVELSHANGIYYSKF